MCPESLNDWKVDSDQAKNYGNRKNYKPGGSGLPDDKKKSSSELISINNSFQPLNTQDDVG